MRHLHAIAAVALSQCMDNATTCVDARSPSATSALPLPYESRPCRAPLHSMPYCRPSFIIIGAGKAGTSSQHTLTSRAKQKRNQVQTSHCQAFVWGHNSPDALVIYNKNECYT